MLQERANIYYTTPNFLSAIKSPGMMAGARHRNSERHGFSAEKCGCNPLSCVPMVASDQRSSVEGGGVGE